MKKQDRNLTEKVIDTFKPTSDKEIPSDVQGSYTGNPLNGTEPVQDADDL